MQLPRQNYIENLPVTSIVAVTQTAVGCGIGLLLAGRMREKAQRNTAIAMLSLGIVSTLPVILDFFTKHLNRPESARGIRRRLESIRQDSGFSSENADIF